MVVHVFCKRLFPMFHLFFRCMLQVCLFGCCICSTHMFQVFICMLHMCCNGFQVFHVFFASVLDACFKHFICLQTYVASVVSECFKSRSSVVSPSSPCCLLLVFCYIASFSDCGRGAPRDGGVDASTRSPLLLCGQVALRSLQFFYYTGC
jgi:hypothetical protein